MTKQSDAAGDVVLLDGAAERVVDERCLPSMCGWSAFNGRTRAGFPEVVARRGVVAFRDAKVVAGGRLLDVVPVEVAGMRA